MLAALPSRGHSVYWELADPRATVVFSLTPTGNRGARAGWTAALVAAAIALLGLSFFPDTLARLRAVLPELWMLLAALGMLAWGISLPGLVALALGGAARLIWLGRAAQRWAAPAGP